MRKRLPDDPKLLALLENAVQAHSATLTKRMLAFARRQELKQEAIDIPDLVRGMSDLLQRSLGPSVVIETRFPLVSKPVLGDANQIEMILLNLTVNARDAMPEGGQIVIATRDEILHPDEDSQLKPGAYVCLTVHDTGIGMDEATLRRAMEPFFTTKGPGKGTGLVCQWYTVAPNTPADGLRGGAGRAKAQRPSFGCGWQRSRLRPKLRASGS